MAISRRDFVGTAGFGLATIAAAPNLLLGQPESTGSHRVRGPLVGRTGPLIPRTLVVGIGSAGGSILGVIPTDIPGLQRAAVQLDVRAFDHLDVDRKLVIGRRSTRGLGCGSRPEWGRRAAEDSAEEIDRFLHDANPDLVFLVGGMGGGTFTGAAPVFARSAREAGILTIAVATRPFEVEGRGRNRRAASGLPELIANTDTTVAVPNDGVIDITGTKILFVDALRFGSEVAASAIRAITDLLTVPGRVNVGFADIRAVFQARGLGAVGIGVASGKDRSVVAAHRALASPFLREADPGRATAALFQVAGGDVGLDEVRRVSEIMYCALGAEADVIFADTPVDRASDELCVTLVSLGCVPPWQVPVPRVRSAGNRPVRLSAGS